MPGVPRPTTRKPNWIMGDYVLIQYSDFIIKWCSWRSLLGGGVMVDFCGCFQNIFFNELQN